MAAASPRIESARFVSGEVWWGETVPAEGGRTTIRRRNAAGEAVDILPAPWNARSRVHEYGGGAWTASDDGVLYFVEQIDQGVWSLRPGEAPRPLTPADRGARFGGLSMQHGRLLAVRESEGDGVAPRRDIVEIATGGALHVTSLAAGSDFVAHPALSPAGDWLAWIAWNHPDMPWDRSQLRVGRLRGGAVADAAVVAGGDSSPLQPVWTADDELLYADDPTGRWNLWRVRPARRTGPEAVAPVDADTGGALWSLGTRWFAPLADGRVVAVRTQGGDEAVVVDPATGAARPIGLALTAGVSIEDVRGTTVLVGGAGIDTSRGLWLVDVDRPEGAVRIAGAAGPWSAAWLPRPRAVSYPGRHGTVHALDYPPTNPEVTGAAGPAPYLVLVHGGPTDHVAPAASGKIAYFTSRGIGVLDVNYGGSTGYGRAYRERLRGQWGVVDVDDVAAAARGLVAEGRADAARLAIEGGSAGGFTVLAALANTDVFAAGISRYGVADARALAAETHDFEARYLDGLIGPLPQAEELYLERSPLTYPARFTVPVLLLQGADDPVVPPRQAEAIRDALAARGVPHAYVLYPGEGHGFRRRETTIDVLEKELAFLGRVFGVDTDAPPLALSGG